LKRILALKYDLFKKGHVFIGFSCCGKYLLSYFYTIQAPDESVNFLPYRAYSYSLHWWLFDLWSPLKIVNQVKLFHNEDINEELLIMVNESTDVDYMVVHGCYDDSKQSNGKKSYVSIIPNGEMISTDVCIHLHYELLQPHPPFVPKISLKIPNILILNCGDILFAIIMNNKTGCEKENIMSCYCTLLCKGSVDSSHNDQVASHCCEPCGDNSCEPDSSTNKPLSNNSSTPNNNKKTLDTDTPENSLHISSSSSNTSDIDYTTNEKPIESDFTSYIVQGFTVAANEDSQNSLPSSPFDCTTTVMPCHVTSSNGLEQLKLTYEHRCFRKANKGSKEGCDYFISQSQFDAENFVNSEAQMTLSDRFISMRDYDMQIVDVCCSEKSVVILLNALIILRDPVLDNCSNNVLTNLMLNLYTVGYLLSWNVIDGNVKVLRKSQPLLQNGSSINVKCRRYNPSLAQSMQMYRRWYSPSSKAKSVRTLTNHNVFSGVPMAYLFHPIIPVAVVLETKE